MGSWSLAPAIGSGRPRPLPTCIPACPWHPQKFLHRPLSPQFFLIPTRFIRLTRQTLPTLTRHLGALETVWS